MVKLVLIIISVVVIIYFSYSFSQRYKVKLNLFDDMIFVAEKLKEDISFFKFNAFDILKECSGKLGNDSLSVLNSVLKKEEVKSHILNEDENKMFNNYFSLLGQADCETELNRLQAFNNYLTKQQIFYNEKVNKEGNLFFKLGLCLAIVVIIILA